VGENSLIVLQGTERRAIGGRARHIGDDLARQSAVDSRPTLGASLHGSGIDVRPDPMEPGFTSTPPANPVNGFLRKAGRRDKGPKG